MNKKQLQQQLQDVQAQFQEIEAKIENLDQVMQDIKDFKELKKGDETWIPIHNGIFVKAKLEDSKEFMINIGGQTITKKTGDEVITSLNKQKDELIVYRDQIVEMFGTLIQQLEKD